MNTQAKSARLFSNSLPVLGRNIERQSPLWRCDAYNTLQSYGTINDFLADYRHESCDVLSFLSCLEESEIASNNKGIDLEDPRSKMVLTSAEHAWSQHLSSLCPTSAVGTFGKQQATFTAVGEKRARDFAVDMIDVRSSGKITRFDVDCASQDELRRRKNREYQRRFREKKMRLELQRRASAVCNLGL